MNVHFSSKTNEWATPQTTFDRLDQEFHFVLDVCASHANAKCARYFTREQDGLEQPWRGSCWMNPPYGREIGKWIQKAAQTAWQGFGTVVCLLPARTDTRWWHEYCAKAELRFIRGRLKFGDSKCGAPFPSVIVIFRAKQRQNFALSPLHN